MSIGSDFADGFPFIFDNWSDLLQQKLIEHVILSAEAIGISILIGVPLGCFLGHIHRFSFLAINTSNVARALPTVAILAILQPATGIGNITAIIALIILAFPPILTNTYVAVDQVDDDTVDAARGIGLTPWQVLSSVELPLAMPLIFAGMRTSAVFVVATATLQGVFGGGGLGDVISSAATYGLVGVLGASYVLIALTIVAQLLFLALEYVLTPVGLRRQRGLRRAVKAGGDLPGSSTATPEQAVETSLEEGQLETQGSNT